jgi:hypothetical protein
VLAERLREAELRDRVDLLEIAADFQQLAVLAWLLGGATVFEGECLGAFTLERKLADWLLVALENGFHPWWNRARELSLKWRMSAKKDSCQLQRSGDVPQ